MFYQGVRLGDILAFGFGMNDASGNHSAGAPAKCIVMKGGESAGAPAIASGDATLFTHANLPVGLYQYVFSVSADAYSVTAGENYLVYAYASASGLSTVACVGGFRLAPPAVDVTRIDAASVSVAMSAIVYTAVTSAIRAVPVLSADAVSVLVKGVLTDYDVPTSADVSALVSTVGHVAVLSALRAVGVLSAQAASVVAAAALADYDVPTSADVSAIAAGALANYDVPTSADVSAIAHNEVSAGWKVMTLVEPTAPPTFASVSPAGALSWLLMLSNNRMVQTSAANKIQNEAGVEIASASCAYDGTTYTRGPFVG